MSNFEKVMIDALAPQVAKQIQIENINGAESFLVELIGRTTPTLEIKLRNTNQAIVLDKCHESFKTVMKHIQTMEPLFLTGPAGSGKSVIAEQAAQSLKFDFASISVCAQTTKTDFLGYYDANGRYITTLFRKIYENGGVFLIDEIDSGNPNVLSVLNAALSGDKFAFPDAIVTKHKDFILVATANTVGKGSTEYVGRNQLDAATLDRFNFIYIGYDTKLEKALVGKNYLDVLDKIHKLRGFIFDKKINIIVSTRSVIKIIKLLDVGLDFEQCLRATVFKSSDEETIKMVMDKIKG